MNSYKCKVFKIYSMLFAVFFDPKRDEGVGEVFVAEHLPYKDKIMSTFSEVVKVWESLSSRDMFNNILISKFVKIGVTKRL